jgi:hypothetical protein
VLSDASPPEPLTDAIAVIAPRPVLLIAAGDVDDEVRLGQRFAATAPATTQLWVVPDAGHTAGSPPHHRVDDTGARPLRARARTGPDHGRT